MINDPPMPPTIPHPDNVENLTPRHRAIVLDVARGFTIQQIARRAHRSRRTIDHQLDEIRERIGTRDRVAITRFAIRAGLIEP